jgi:restriction system protein
MAIPTFQAVMRPLLELAADGKELRTSEAVEILGDQFHLTKEEREELLPSGRQRRFNNRVAWATAYFRATGLFVSPGRGRYTITERGRQAIASGQQIDLKYLSQFPELAAFRTGTAVAGEADKQPPTEASTATPDEILESTYQALRKQLAADLLERVHTVEPAFFEKLVVDLLIAMGYGGSRKEAGKAIGQSGDEGIDGIINEDKLGLDVVYIQAKRWASGNTVGRREVQMFTGSLEGKRASKGVFITTSTFTSDARSYVQTISKKIVLIDGEELAQLMIDHGVGVADVNHYVTKRVDQDYFEVD